MRRSSLVAVSLFACTSTADPARPAARGDAPSAPVDKPQPADLSAPVVAPTPPSPATPAIPTTSPPPDDAPKTVWWCTCYARTIADGNEPVTACRATKDACLALERTVANGARGIVERSVTHACREVLAAHPGDNLGTRDLWKPSKKPGAWLSTGACLLSGEPDPEAAEPPSSLDKLMVNESIGELKWKLAAADVIARLGEPTKKGRIEFEDATGDHLQRWDWPALGLTLTMVSRSRKGPQTISAIEIKSPANFKTSKGLGIGSTRADVMKIHAKHRAEESDPEDDETFIAGSIYGGLFFTFKGDTVTEIFLGAGAE